MEAVVSWTDERVELLRRLWEDGQSASKIAAQLGGVTRNAVIGKVHRLGRPMWPPRITRDPSARLPTDRWNLAQAGP